MNLFGPGSRLPMIYQSRINECGLACLAMVSGYHGQTLELREIRTRFGGDVNGTSVAALLRAGESLCLRGRALQLGPGELRQLVRPTILHWDGDHFVVLSAVSRRRAIVYDPAVGVRRYGLAELAGHFSGIAIEFTPGEALHSIRPARESLTLRRLLGRQPGLKSALWRILCFSALLQMVMLTGPLYLQLVVDQGLGRGDSEFIFVLAVLFALFMVLRALLSYTRGVLTLNLTSRLGMAMVSDTFRHLLRLPLAWFERREMGDLVSRFSSLETIKQIVTQEMVTVIVDGVFSLITIVLLYLYHPGLATIVLLSTLLFSLTRLLTIPLEKNLRQEALVAGATQQSRFMENIRRIETVKLNRLEADRQQDWESKYSHYVQAGLRLGHFQLGISTWQSLLFAVENITTIYLGAQAALYGQLTLGQLMSFIFLKQHFINSVSALLPKLSEIRLLRLDLERVAEIRLEPAGEQRDKPVRLKRPELGVISVRGLSFQYEARRSALIEGLDFTIAPHTITVISGRSGSGKTTLIYLLLGLALPDSGQISVDGRVLADGVLSDFSDQVSVVLHNDNLLAGDIAFNINLGVEPFDRDRLQLACERAGILALIESLPMGFASRVGEMGSGLSAGQTKRLLLARAFYRQPSLIVLDETLTHLGSGAADLVQTMRDMGVTALIVSHEAEVIAAADQIIQLPTGAVTPVTRARHQYGETIND